MMKKQANKDFDNWDLMGDLGSFGLGDFEPPDNWDLMGGGGDEVDNWDLMGGGDDPYANWGGGQGGDGTNGSGDFGSGAGGMSGLSGLWSQITRLFGGGGGSGGGSGGGLGGLGSLIPLLAMGGGAAFGNSNTREATQQMMEANRRAEDLITNRLNGPSPFLPYTDQGREAIWNMNATGARPLAGNYQPLGSGRGMSLGKLAKGK